MEASVTIAGGSRIHPFPRNLQEPQQYTLFAGLISQPVAAFGLPFPSEYMEFRLLSNDALTHRSVDDGCCNWRIGRTHVYQGA
jgi:hypothetical protein